MIKSLNKYDYFIILIIGSLSMGMIQVSVLGQHVIIGVFCLPFALKEIAIMFFSKKRPKAIVFFMILWLLYAGISLLWTIDQKNGLGPLWNLFWHIIIFLGIYSLSFRASEPVKTIILGWTLLFAITLPIAVWEITSGDHLGWGDFNEGAQIEGMFTGIDKRVFAAVTYGNLNSYTTVLCAALPFVMAGAFLFRRKLICIIVGLSIGIIVLINASRAGFVCLIIIYFLFTLFYRKSSFKHKRFILYLFVFLLIIVILYGREIVFNQIFGRLSSYQGDFFADAGRWDVLELGWKLCVDSTFLGWGVGSMDEAYLQTGFWLNYAHNALMEFLVEYGLLLFIPFIVIFTKYIFSLLKCKDITLKFVGYSILFMFIPWSVIDDTYFGESLVWMFLASIAVLGELARNDKFKANLINTQTDQQLG